jgi:uncharacterized protein (DUF2235 family)
MARNILVFNDGTGNEGGILPDESRTNVYKLFRATRSGPDSVIDPRKQCAFYIHGIGTPEPGKPIVARDHIDQMFGGGLTKRIIDGYASILSVWQPGDRIYLFGFSRGAYVARCLAHVVELFGIPTQDAEGRELSLEPGSLRKICKEAVRILYFCGYAKKESARRTKGVEQFQRKHACQIGSLQGASPYFIGVWETVAAVGWSRLFKTGYDLHLPKSVRFARHAMAIDEYRKDFARVKWGGHNLPETLPGEPDAFQQVWFAGNHADIGGSYPENESRLSDIALNWMVDFIQTKLPVDARVLIDDRVLALYPAADGMMHDECMVGINGTRLKWYPGNRDVPHDAILHSTVYERLQMKSVRNFSSYGKYRPFPLRNHDEAKQYFEPELQPTVRS